MDTINNDLTNLLQQMGVHKESLGITQRIVIIAGILIIAFVADYFCRKIVVPTIKKLTARTQATWDDYLFNDAVLDNMCHLIPPIILYVLLPFAFPHEPVTLTFILKLCWVYITAVAMKLICSFLTSLYTISSEHEKLKNHPLKGVYQMIKLIVICVGVIIIVSTLIDKDPVNILTGLGASAAILMLVFKDTIMGLVAGVQLSANDMLRPGDWITMPKYGADGTVIEVTLTTVKVRNWDNTITTVPPYALVSDSFQNWRGMRESGPDSAGVYEFDEARRSADMLLMKADFNKENTELTLTLTTPDYMSKETAEKLKPFLRRPVVYHWKNGAFSI